MMVFFGKHCFSFVMVFTGEKIEKRLNNNLASVRRENTVKTTRQYGMRFRKNKSDYFLHTGYVNERFRREQTHELTKSSNDSLFMFVVPHGHLHTGSNPISSTLSKNQTHLYIIQIYFTSARISSSLCSQNQKDKYTWHVWCKTIALYFFSEKSIEKCLECCKLLISDYTGSCSI